MTDHPMSEAKTERLPRLTNRQRAFLELLFVNCFNATKTARDLKMGKTDGAIRIAAHRMVTNANMAKHVEARMKALAMPTEEVLMRLSAMARADFSDFLERDADGKVKRCVDMQAVANKGMLVKAYKAAGEKSPEELHLHDPLRALELLGKGHKLFTDNIEVNPSGNPIQFLVKDIDLGKI